MNCIHLQNYFENNNNMSIHTFGKYPKEYGHTGCIQTYKS